MGCLRVAIHIVECVVDRYDEGFLQLLDVLFDNNARFLIVQFVYYEILYALCVCNKIKWKTYLLYTLSYNNYDYWPH